MGVGRRCSVISPTRVLGYCQELSSVAINQFLMTLHALVFMPFGRNDLIVPPILFLGASGL